MAQWITACSMADLLDEDIVTVTLAGQSYALCLDDDDTPHCTGPVCPRDGANLAGGLVDGDVIICPMEDCRFHLTTGLPADDVADVALAIYPARINGDMVEISLT